MRYSNVLKNIRIVCDEWEVLSKRAVLDRIMNVREGWQSGLTRRT